MLACPRRRKRMRSRALTAQHSTRKSIGQLSLTAGVVAQRGAAAAAAAITDCYHSGGTSSCYWCYARRYYSSRCSGGAPPEGTTRSSPLPAGSSARRTNNCRSQFRPQCTREAATTCYLVERHARQCALRVMACRTTVRLKQLKRREMRSATSATEASVPRVCLLISWVFCLFARLLARN